MYYNKKQLTAVFISVLLTATAGTSAFASCPASDTIHPQKIFNKQANNEFVEGHRLIAKDTGGSAMQWISGNYQDSDQTLTLRKVQIASLEAGKHGLTCIYNDERNDPLYRITMYEPIFYNMNYSKIKLTNPDEWKRLFDDEYGYVCTVSTNVLCDWSYSY